LIPAWVDQYSITATAANVDLTAISLTNVNFTYRTGAGNITTSPLQAATSGNISLTAAAGFRTVNGAVSAGSGPSSLPRRRGQRP